VNAGTYEANDANKDVKSMRQIRKRLATLFDEWLRTYPKRLWREFHKDGIVSEDWYWRETHRLLFVQLEPNSKGGWSDRFLGRDLRELFAGEELNWKPGHRNLALWTRALLDGVTKFDSPAVGPAQEQLRRVAIINLKKLAGSGTADHAAISVQAWHDRAMICRQVRLIRPTLVVTCGEFANRIFGRVVRGDPFKTVPDDAVWTHRQLTVLPANHPSVRPTHARQAFERLVSRAKQYSVAAFS
jgi:hypothetical protein